MDTKQPRRRIDYSDLLLLAASLQGQTLQTIARGKQFTVEVDGDIIVYTPLSTGKPRRGSPSTAEIVLEKYYLTGSLKSGDYSGKTANSSYLTKLFSILSED